MNNQNFLTLAGQLVLASTSGNEKEIQRISFELASQFDTSYRENADEHSAFLKDITGFLNFTNKEISKMPKAFKHTFIAEGKVICYRKRKRGRVSCSYEARYRRHGYNISVSTTNLIDLKQKFIEALHAAESGSPAFKVPTNFNEFSLYWFNNFHKRKVAVKTFDHDIKLYERHIKAGFGKFSTRSINAVALQTFLDKFEDRPKTAQDLYSIFNQIFDCAVKHGIIQLNPLGMCYRVQYRKEHGTLITKTEETQLLNAYNGTEWELPFAIVLYTGLRPDEYLSATIDGKFIKAKNSKHGKNGEIVYKRIPITPMLRPYLQGITEIKMPKPRMLNVRFKKVLPKHKLYDMRTTFQTRCSECGISENAIGIFMGNSIGKLKDAYTDFSEDYLLKEGEKLKY